MDGPLVKAMTALANWLPHRARAHRSVLARQDQDRDRAFRSFPTGRPVTFSRKHPENGCRTIVPDMWQHRPPRRELYSRKVSNSKTSWKSGTWHLSEHKIILVRVRCSHVSPGVPCLAASSRAASRIILVKSFKFPNTRKIRHLAHVRAYNYTRQPQVFPSVPMSPQAFHVLQHRPDPRQELYS